MGAVKAYTADHIFTGDHWLSGHAVIVGDSKILSLVNLSSVPADLPVTRFEGSFLAPAFIDLQIYGAHGKLLAVYPERESLAELNDYCRNGGAAFCMPTVATNTYEVFYRCIDAVRDYWKAGGAGVLGLHIEGPWINPEKRGAHIEELVHSPTLAQAQALLEYGRGVIRMITLAPEKCSREVIDLILSYGIIISAGHSNAGFEEATHAFSLGISAVTHLYNAMSPLQHRAPGLVGAAMDHPSVMASIIPDGHHVDFAAVRIARQVMGERLFIITDAVTQTDTGQYQHELAGDKYEAAGILSGSALTMGKAYFNLVSEVKVEKAEALRMCSLYPARVIGRQTDLGRIAPGYEAAMAVIDETKQSVVVIG